MPDQDEQVVRLSPLSAIGTSSPLAENTGTTILFPTPMIAAHHDRRFDALAVAACATSF